MSAPALADPPKSNRTVALTAPPSEPAAWAVVLRFFGDDDRARRWFQSPHRGLNGRTPAEAAETPEGDWEVRAIIGRVEHGVVG